MAEFSQDLFDTICSRIAEGESLRAICEGDDMPSREAVRKWLASDEELVGQYAHARDAQADKIFDECLEIADQYDQAGEKMEGGTDHIQRAKLRIDTRKWMAGKLRPKVYGDKIDVTSGNKPMSFGGVSLVPLEAED